mmetsp:Transcript_95804/g.219594  ORF Transcript_95804/g.219594 Transcript_95804/m.219594 type:complete len:143 (+) Transcript_95804:66-494(+)
MRAVLVVWLFAATIGDADWSDTYWRSVLLEGDTPPEVEWYDVEWPTVAPFVPLDGPLLHVGVGTSTWPRATSNLDMIHTDLSDLPLSRLRAAQPSVRTQVEDVTKMSFPSGQFKAVVEKGTLDGVFMGGLRGAEAALAEVRE